MNNSEAKFYIIIDQLQCPEKSHWFLFLVIEWKKATDSFIISLTSSSVREYERVCMYRESMSLLNVLFGYAVTKVRNCIIKIKK